MIILESDDVIDSQYRDPRTELTQSQLRSRLSELRQLTETDWSKNEEHAFRTCDVLCEATRDVLFRLHKVTRSELRKILGLFQDAAGEIKKVSQAGLSDSDMQEDVEGYLRHVEGRISLISKYLGINMDETHEPATDQDGGGTDTKPSPAK